MERTVEVIGLWHLLDNHCHLTKLQVWHMAKSMAHLDVKQNRIICQ